MRTAEVLIVVFCFIIPEVPFDLFFPRHVWTWQVLLATLSDNVVVSKQTGKVRDKDRTWDSVKKSLLGNINGFLEELKVLLQRRYMIRNLVSVPLISIERSVFRRVSFPHNVFYLIMKSAHEGTG